MRVPTGNFLLVKKLSQFLKLIKECSKVKSKQMQVTIATKLKTALTNPIQTGGADSARTDFGRL